MSARDPKRGRHKKRTSLETRAWERDHLPPPAPSWMPPETSAALLALRAELDPLAHQPRVSR